jgi:hypothetical protein
MKTNRTLLTWCLLSALFLGVSSGAILVVQTVQTYSGACEKLTGFPGVLQKAGFLPEGSCNSHPHSWKDCHHHNCVVDGKAGHCVSQQLPEKDPVSDQDFICVCKPNKPSH